ncbi:MAG: hypothetical protein ACRBFS_21705 [Aureispira sp.]
MANTIKKIDCASIEWDGNQGGGQAILVTNNRPLYVGEEVGLKERKTNQVVLGRVTEKLFCSSIEVKTFWGFYRTKTTYIFRFERMHK